MPPADRDELGLRLALAAEALAQALPKLEGRVETLTRDFAAHRTTVEPFMQAYGTYLQRLTAEEDQATAEARAGLKAAQDRAAAAKAEEEAQRATTRTQVWTWLARVLIPLVAAAAGAGGLAAYQDSSPSAQEAPP